MPTERKILTLALCVLAAAGCAKQSTGASGAPTSALSREAAGPDIGHGRSVFSSNCQACHGVRGAGGGIGPSLHNEHARKDRDAAIAWIKNPQPPMPKLFPGTLSEKDVDDVAAYVESL